MRIQYKSIAAIAIYGKKFAIHSLLDDTSIFESITTIEIGYPAHLTIAKVFIILIIASILSFVYPGCTISQIQISSITIVNNALQIRISGCKSHINRSVSIFVIQNKNIAFKFNIAATRSCTTSSQIHANGAFISS